MGWKHYQTVDHPKWEPQVGRELFAIRLLILHFKFQFSKSIISYFPQFNQEAPDLTYPLRRMISVNWNVTEVLVERLCWATSKQPSCVPPPKPNVKEAGLPDGGEIIIILTSSIVQTFILD